MGIFDDIPQGGQPAQASAPDLFGDVPSVSGAQPAPAAKAEGIGSLHDPSHPVLSDDPRDWPKPSPNVIHKIRAWLDGRSVEVPAEQPSEYRGTFLPFTKKPGESAELAVPGIVHAPYEAAKGVYERGAVHPSELTPDDVMRGLVAASAAIPATEFASPAVRGAAAPAVVSGTADAARQVSQAATQPIRDAVNPGVAADRRIAQAYQADLPPPALGRRYGGPAGPGEMRPATQPADMTPEMLQHSGANALQERGGSVAEGSYGGDVRLMDIGGERTRALARSAANLAPEARETLNRVIQPRFETQGPRFIEFLESMSGGNAQASRDALQEMAKTARAPFYERAFDDGAFGVQSPALAKLAETPALKDAIAKAQKAMADAEGAGMLRTSVAGEGGSYTLEFWDQVKRVLDDRVGNLSKDRFTAEAARVDSIRSRLVNELDEAIPSYAHARGVAHGIFKANDALDAGEQFVTSKIANEDARRGLSLMSPQEQNLFRQGFVSRYIAHVNEIGDRRNILNTIAKSSAARERMEIALGSEGARDLEAFLRHENMMDFVRGAVGGNSTTARQLMELGLASGAGGLVTSFDPHNPASWVAGILTGFFVRRGAARMNAAIDTRLATEIAERLTSRDPTVYRRGLAQLAEPKMLDRLRSFDELLDAMAKGGGPRVLTGDEPKEKKRAIRNSMGTPDLRGNAMRAAVVADGATATNPSTGARVIRRDGQWVPLQQDFQKAAEPPNAMGTRRESTSVEDRRPDPSQAHLSDDQILKNYNELVGRYYNATGADREKANTERKELLFEMHRRGLLELTDPSASARKQ